MLTLVLALLSACSTPSEPSKPAAAPVAPAATLTAAAPEDHEAHHANPLAEHPTAVPDSYAGIVVQLHEHHAEIATLLAAGHLKDIHPHAQAIMDLAVAMPEKAPADKKATVSLKALDMKEKADELHDKADDGDAAGAKAAFDAVVADIEALDAVDQ